MGEAEARVRTRPRGLGDPPGGARPDLVGGEAGQGGAGGALAASAGVCGETGAGRGVGRFGGLRGAGIDETSHEKGHECLTVVDHDRGCLAWAHEGHGRDVPGPFPDEPAREQRRPVEVAATDGARWTGAPARRRRPDARWAMDPSRVVEWVRDAPGGARSRDLRAREGARRGRERGPDVIKID